MILGRCILGTCHTDITLSNDSQFVVSFYRMILKVDRMSDKRIHLCCEGGVLDIRKEPT